jgi:hypothetical protein
VPPVARASISSIVAPPSQVTLVALSGVTMADVAVSSVVPLKTSNFRGAVEHPSSRFLLHSCQQADRDRSTTFRSLQKLVSLGLCVKETKTIKDGGYFHVYSVVDMETFKKETERKVKDLQKSLDRLLKKFEGEMQTAISSMYKK